MQFQVPQFIDTEDRIVGPFTIRQFIYVAAAGGIGFFLYFTVEPWLSVSLSIVLVTVALALAFIKINGRSLPHLLLSAFRFYWHPQTYVWQPEQTPAGRREAALPGKTLSLENIVAGIALRNAWRNLQTGAQGSLGQLKERYEIFQKLSGERQAARRVDYR